MRGSRRSGEAAMGRANGGRTAEGARRGAYSFRPRRLHRGPFLKWLRRTHGWLGLWGAVLRLFFSFTGSRNHRDILPIKLPRGQHASSWRCRSRRPPRQMAAWLQQALKIEDPPKRVVVTPRRDGMGRRQVWQPEQWRVSFSVPHHGDGGLSGRSSHVRIQDFRPNVFMTSTGCTAPTASTSFGCWWRTRSPPA
jgi:hypothetical protein